MLKKLFFTFCTSTALSASLLPSAFCLPSVALAEIPAPSDNWVVTGRSPQGDLMLVDAKTTSKSGAYAGFWFQTNHPNNAVDRVYAVANCAIGSIVPMWVVSTNGRMIVENKKVVNHPPVSVPAGSLAEGAYKYACFGNKSKSFQELLNERIAEESQAINRAMQLGVGTFR